MSTTGSPGATEPPALLCDADYPADPYPGARPACSFVHLPGGVAHPLDDDGAGGWLVGHRSLAGWLADRGQPGLAERVAVLAYGSNACPAKITWLRDELGLTGDVPVLRCRTVGLAAVWAAHPRARDGQVPAVLAGMPGRAESHAVWLASPDQVEVLDVCEGRGERYQLARLGGPLRVDLDGTATLPELPLAYVSLGEVRAPLLHEGRFVPVSEVDQAGVHRLIAGGARGGAPDSHGLTVVPVP